MAKKELRQQLKAARLSITPQQRQSKSQDISHKLATVLSARSFSSIHCFEPLEELGEVAISIDYDSPIFTSRKVGHDWHIVPVTDDNTVPEQFDVIIVPMLGFDPKTMHRIGYGGGYYDKFLATQSQAKKIGVCFEAGKVENLPAEPHDIPMDMILTEDAVYDITH